MSSVLFDKYYCLENQWAPFQGDKAGVLLYSALHATGFSNQSDVLDYAPDLVLTGAKITNACRCVPPQNKVFPAEFVACRPYLQESLSDPKITDILCIGGDAYQQVQKALGEQGPPFAPKAYCNLGRYRVALSYHTSGYNQSTKRITLADVIEVLEKIKNGRARRGECA